MPSAGHSGIVTGGGTGPDLGRPVQAVSDLEVSLDRVLTRVTRSGKSNPEFFDREGAVSVKDHKGLCREDKGGRPRPCDNLITLSRFCATYS